MFRQAVKFIGYSGIGWILDFCVYTGFGFVSSNLALNNMISSWVGVTFVFIFATRRIFENNSRISLRWKYLIYIGYQVVLIFLISKLLAIVNFFIVQNVKIDILMDLAPVISKIMVTPVTMALNFIVMKYVIEKL